MSLLRKLKPYLAGFSLCLAIFAGAYAYLVQQMMPVSTFGLLKNLRGDLFDYHQASGAYPASLADLPKQGSREPVDAWGQPVIYRRVGDGYVIASFGRDGKEDQPYDWTAMHQLVFKENNPPHSGPFRGADCQDLGVDQIATEGGWYRSCGK